MPPCRHPYIQSYLLRISSFSVFILVVLLRDARRRLLLHFSSRSCDGYMVVRLVRARHAFSLRTVHTGTCVYVAMFVPYAALQAVTLGQLGFLNDKGSDGIARASVQISSSSAFAAFFGLGFSGKVALVQMWAHVVRMHSSGSCDVSPRLQGTLASTLQPTRRSCGRLCVL